MFDNEIRALGELELAIMEVLWARKGYRSVREVNEALAERDLAYTTVMTVMGRLHEKGFLVREKQGLAFLYQPTCARVDYESALVSKVLGKIPTASREALLCGFLDFASEDEALLQELEKRIAERKKAL